MRKDAKKEKSTNSLSVSVCSNWSEIVCAHISVCACRKYAHTWLHYSDILSCLDLRLITASSSSCGGSTTVFSNSKCMFSIGTMLSLN